MAMLWLLVWLERINVSVIPMAPRVCVLPTLSSANSVDSLNRISNIPLLQVVIEHWIELFVSHSKFPLFLLPMVIYMFPFYSLNLSYYFLHTLSMSMFSKSVSPLLP